MGMSLLLLAAGFLLLYLGAEGLVRGSVTLALRAGLSPLVVGLTVVAFGTSSPELVVSMGAALGGTGDIALGNVVGSNICNIALILGISALIRPMHIEARIVRLDVPLVIASAVLMILLLLDGQVSRLDGLLLAAGLFLYLFFNIHQASRGETAVVQEEFAEGLPKPAGFGLGLLLTIGGLGLLTFGADLFVKGAVALAAGLGISQAVIGLTVVAIGTSLPELATSILAAVRKEGDLAVGNVIGSNLFNTLGILGLTAAVQPIAAGGIGWVDLAVMTGFSLLLLPLMRTGFCLNRWEGALLLSGYLTYTASRFL